MSDEHSGRVMGAAWNKIIKTPWMDSLAEEGFLFRNAYVQNPICVPSRASVATGSMPSKVGVFGNFAHPQDVLRDYPLSIARIFKAAGYTAEWLGEEHWGTTNIGLGFGNENKKLKNRVNKAARDFNALRKEVGPLPERAQTFNKTIRPAKDTVYTDRVIELLEEYDGSKPFFLGLSIVMPHFPFLVEERFYNMYKNVINLPRVTQRMLQNLPFHNNRDREKFGFGKLTPFQTKRARAVYYGMITYVDEQLGRVIKKLIDLGLRKDTIVVYVSDHGDQAGEHGLWYKNSFYEDSVKVPMILSHPGVVPSNRTLWWPVQLMDLVPTLYDLCNINIPAGLDGKNLMPVIRGQEKAKKRYAISETYTITKGARMIRIRKWKYCWYSEGGHQLFNTHTDPAEEFNLYNNTKYAKLIRNLHRKMMWDSVPTPWSRE